MRLPVKEEFANIHDVFILCVWFVTCVFSCECPENLKVDFVALQVLQYPFHPVNYTWAESSWRDRLYSVISTAERVEIKHNLHTLGANPQWGLYSGMYCMLSSTSKKVNITTSAINRWRNSQGRPFFQQQFPPAIWGGYKINLSFIVHYSAPHQTQNNELNTALENDRYDNIM